MTVTQFADTCGIPRPSMSQLLSGRNKKVSNELIGKIHDAFPDLDVLWLMFGQGDMLVKKNIQVSEPQNDPAEPLSRPQGAYRQHIPGSILDFGATTADEPGKSAAQPDPAAPAPSAAPAPISTIDAPPVTTAPQPRDTDRETIESLSRRADKSKRIVNIIVYYSDNSFEAFVPE